jgi:uncharacterized protein YbjT (DUF2867 family)
VRSARRPSTSCASGHTVSAYVRSPGKVPAGWGADVTVVVGEITDAAAIDRAVAGADAVVSALGRLGFNVTRADIARFTAAQVDDTRYVGATPAISN